MTPDGSADGTESSFRVQFTRFAEEIRQLVTAVFGGDLDAVATHVATRSRIFAEVPLTVAGENLARLKIDVWCCLDSYQQFLAVEESTYQLIAQVDRTPIMRFEYERGATSKPTPHSMESLHLPVGGDRFRPCLEDVIEFLVVECRFDCQVGWRTVLETGRERWRRMQTRTAVRDSPSEAATALRALGYAVAAPDTANAPQDNLARMRRW